MLQKHLQMQCQLPRCLQAAHCRLLFLKPNRLNLFLLRYRILHRMSAEQVYVKVPKMHVNHNHLMTAPCYTNAVKHLRMTHAG